MNYKQELAIENFEIAAKVLEEAGLALAGIDSELYVFSKNKFDKIKKNAATPIIDILPQIEIIAVECPYLESAGW